MTDQLAWRKKFGVLAPSTNSIVEPDFNRMGVPGVTPLFSRIHIYDADLSSEAQMEKLRVQLDESIDYAVDLVITAEVDYMVMGMSAETFWDGKEGNEHFKARVKERSGGLDVATGVLPTTCTRSRRASASASRNTDCPRECRPPSRYGRCRRRNQPLVRLDGHLHFVHGLLSPLGV